MKTTWTTKDGRKLTVHKMSDDHLVAALRMGMRAESKRLREMALTELGHAFSPDSNGAEDAACSMFDAQLRQSRSTLHLKTRLATNPRYAPLVAEVNKRGLRVSRPHTSSRTH